MKIVYTYRVVCQKLSAPSSGPTLPTAFWPRGTSAAASRSYSLSPTYRWTAPSSRPSHAAAPPPSSTPATCWTWSRMPSAGKAFRPQRLDQGRGAPFCRVSYSARDTSHMLFPASAVLTRVCLPCAFLCGHRNLLVSSCSYSGVSKNHIRGLLNM